ncbi:hypothetical protein [Dactylosporangium darangshiense]|uniref:hypothetical protein n=1 Tax=Dactylosporangium darangshiense TaxID=579108 RepID=UPI0031EE4065
MAIWRSVPAGDARRWWNLKDTAELDGIVESAPAVRLGKVATCGCEPEPASPARRVADLLFLRGTLPEQFADEEVDAYVLPLLNEELRDALLDAFQPGDNDLPTLGAGDREEITIFLDKHMGARVLTTSRGEVIEARLDHRRSC